MTGKNSTPSLRIFPVTTALLHPSSHAPKPVRRHQTSDYRETMDSERLKPVEQESKELVEKMLNGIASSVTTHDGDWDGQGKTYTTVFIVEVPTTFIDDECDYDS